MVKKDNFIKNNTSEYLSKTNWHNPNTYNGVDSVLSYAIILVVFFAIGYAIIPLSKFIIKIADYGTALCVSAIITQGCLVLLSVIFSKIKKVPLLCGSGFIFKLNFKQIAYSFMLVIGIYFVISPLHMDFATDLGEVQNQLFGFNYLQQSAVNFNDMGVVSILVYLFILVPILPAICEEMLFRGVVMRGLREYGSIFSCLTSGLLFALMHGNYAQLILQFILGSCIAGVVTITDNFANGCVMHFINNSFAVLLEIIIAVFTEINFISGTLLKCTLIIIGIAFLIISINYFLKIALDKHKKSILNGVNINYSCKNDNKYNMNSCILQNDEFGGKMFPVAYNNRYDLSCYDKNRYFLNNGKFVKFNKSSNKIAFKILLSFGIIFAVLQIALAFFNII